MNLYLLANCLFVFGGFLFFVLVYMKYRRKVDQRQKIDMLEKTRMLAGKDGIEDETLYFNDEHTDVSNTKRST